MNGGAADENSAAAGHESVFHANVGSLPLSSGSCPPSSRAARPSALQSEEHEHVDDYPATGLAGSALGYLAQFGLGTLVADLMELELPAPGPMPAVSGVFVARTRVPPRCWGSSTVACLIDTAVLETTMNNERYFPNLRRHHWRVRLRLLSCVLLLASLSGCSSNLVEVDRMSGTLAPPRQVMIDQESFSVASIYADAKVRTFLLEDDIDIDPLAAAADCVTSQELDNLEIMYREPETTVLDGQQCLADGSCQLYYAYIAIVDYVLCGNPEQRGYRGFMYDTLHRGSAAIFYPNVESDPAPIYLRTLAHEIGHAFNLHHQDQKFLVDFNIMTPTNDLGSTMPRQAWTLSATQIGYVKDHPKKCVFPGTGSFGSVYMDHAAHAEVVLDCTK